MDSSGHNTTATTTDGPSKSERLVQVCVKPKLRCTICTDEYFADRLLKPCYCGAPFCPGCIKDMFIKACQDVTRMPPHCCRQFQISLAKPYLTETQLALFRRKYEEWSTANPFYCPVPRCSAFIPERLFKSAEHGKGKQRADSVVGVPSASLVQCPDCQAIICTACRDLAHPGAACKELEMGLDKETAKLLKDWGYKRCPKCGHGVRRMFGCDHM
ncbi:hypothetical protein M011DRAFT_411870, partial [Sporormia fimetaria CBS 119925]